LQAIERLSVIYECSSETQPCFGGAFFAQGARSLGTRLDIYSF